MSRVLIADDQPDVLKALRLLKPEGYETSEVTSPAGVLAALEARAFDGLLIAPHVQVAQLRNLPGSGEVQFGDVHLLRFGVGQIEQFTKGTRLAIG